MHDTRQPRFKTNRPGLLAPDYFKQNLLWRLLAHPTARFSPDFNHWENFPFPLSLFCLCLFCSRGFTKILRCPVHTGCSQQRDSPASCQAPGDAESPGSRLETGSEPQGISLSHSRCLRSKGQNECPAPTQKHMIQPRPCWCVHVRWEPLSYTPASCVNLDQSLNLSALTVNKIICEQFKLKKKRDKEIGLV